MSTPAPWYVTELDGTFHVQSAVINEDNYVAQVDSAADARMIVACHPLFDAALAAMEHIEEMCDAHGDDPETIPAYQELIRATGLYTGDVAE